MSLPEELRDGKVGRFPVWAIGVILAGAFVLFMFLRNRSKAKATAGANLGALPDTQYVDNTQNDGLPPGSVGDYLAGDPTNPSYPVGLTPTGIPGPVTNVQWSRLAFDYLIGQGNDPQLVQRGLAKYIQGLSLTAQEQAVVNLALRAFGAPPEGLILSPEEPAPTQNTTTPPPNPAPNQSTPQAQNEVVYTIKSGDTLAGIAARYGMSAAQLYNFGTNAASLEQYAQWHGRASSENGKYIWAGYNIGVPA